MVQEFTDASSCWKQILSDVHRNREMLSVVERFAKLNMSPADIVFGTSGWRGEIGTDFTFHNLSVVTRAVVEMCRSGDGEVLNALGVSSFDEFKKRGVIVGHDNRFLGYKFAMVVLGILQQEGIRTWYAGEAVTPEFSVGIEMLHAAASINLTPSHNPANYGGFKFNPADGGPAGSEITSRIESIANEMMKESVIPYTVEPNRVEPVDLTALYIEYLNERLTLDLSRIRNFVKQEDCLICVDNVHGATRNRVQRIIGESENIRYLRTHDDPLFGGIAPEPSSDNMKDVERALQSGGALFRLGVIMDPDGDRIRFADETMQIPMNYFGAMALHFLNVHKGYNGVAVKSVGTSNLVNAIAKRLKIPVKETKVGFKNFRRYLLEGSDEQAIVAFEESDGISGYHHTLEKDAIFGLLLAVEMMAVTGKNLSSYLDGLMNEYGHYYPDRSGISVDRALTGRPLLQKLNSIQLLYGRGSVIAVGAEERMVKDVITVDGTKLVFDDDSWLMIRPSGTEPKVRFYIEARTEQGKKAIFETAEKIAREAIGTTR